MVTVGMVSNRMKAAAAACVTSPGGFGEAAATRDLAIWSSRSVDASISPDICDRKFVCLCMIIPVKNENSAKRQASLPDANPHRQRPADQKIDDRYEREDFQRTKGRRRKLSTSPRDLRNRNDRSERGIFYQLNEVRGERWERDADSLRKHDASEGLERTKSKDQGCFLVPLWHCLNP